jgi:maltooligosyltrehalose trehalohydrolase
MGEEYGETAPFQYFISHSDPDLIQAVRKGRREEFSAFGWTGTIPDPQSDSTFLQCKLNHRLRKEEWHGILFGFYKELIRLRKKYLSMGLLSKDKMEVVGISSRMALSVYYGDGERKALVIFNISETEVSVPLAPFPKQWRKLLDSADSYWGGSGSPTPEKAEASTEKTIPLGSRSFVILEAQG